MIKLSICIPSIPSRFERLTELVGRIEAQIGSRTDVELIVVIDNKKRTIGEKRNNVKDLAQGRYFSIIDDDDDISDDFVELLLHAIDNTNVDVITFDSMAHIEDQKGLVTMSIDNDNEQWSPEATTKRQPFHMCAWKTEFFQPIMFPFMMYGEDAKWSERCMLIAQTEHHIDAILHHYKWSSTVTEAFER